MKIELCFQVIGKNLPVDHGFALYSALSKILPVLHENADASLALIKGRYYGEGKLDISPSSELVLRVHQSSISKYTVLAGKKLNIMGHKILLGTYRIKLIIPQKNLWAKIVTTKNGQDFSRFEKEIARQLEDLKINSSPKIGKRKTFRIHKKQIVGYELHIQNLTDEQSIVLQEEGIGGRKKMGCGFFEGFTNEV